MERLSVRPVGRCGMRIKKPGLKPGMEPCFWCRYEFDPGILVDVKAGMRLCPGCLYCMRVGAPLSEEEIERIHRDVVEP